MMASTARIIGGSAPYSKTGGPGGGSPSVAYREYSERSLSAPGDGRFRLDRDLGELEIGAAAHAHRVVELDQLAAAGALAAHLVLLGAVRERHEQAEHRHHGADERPDEER